MCQISFFTLSLSSHLHSLISRTNPASHHSTMLLITHVLTTLSTLSTLAIAAKSGSLINGLILNHRRDISPQIANASAVVGAGSHGYTYVGCYNETTGITGSGGARALVGAMVGHFSFPFLQFLCFCFTRFSLPFLSSIFCDTVRQGRRQDRISSLTAVSLIGSKHDDNDSNLSLILPRRRLRLRRARIRTRVLVLAIPLRAL